MVVALVLDLGELSNCIGSYSLLDMFPGVFCKQAFWVDYFWQHQGVSCTLPG